jgi:poly(3-hydroxybutyrate) depolymerase
MAKRKKRASIKKREITNKKNVKIYLLILLFALLIGAALLYFFNFKEKRGIVKEVISIDERQFIFSKKADAENAPVIIVLHGSAQNSTAWFEGNPQGDFVKMAIDQGYAIIAPEALSPFCPAFKQWDFRENSSDIGFFDDIFKWIGLREDLDSERIYVIGISVGGFMASRLAHHYGSDIKAVAIHSAGNADNVVAVPQSCFMQYNYNLSYIKPDHARTLLIHGTNDTIVPFEMSLYYYYSLKQGGRGAVLVPQLGEDHYWFDTYNGVILGWFS